MKMTAYFPSGEKDDNDGALINGGFMVLNPEVFDYLKDDTTVLRENPWSGWRQRDR